MQEKDHFKVVCMCIYIRAWVNVMWVNVSKRYARNKQCEKERKRKSANTHWLILYYVCGCRNYFLVYIIILIGATYDIDVWLKCFDL